MSYMNRFLEYFYIDYFILDSIGSTNSFWGKVVMM